MPIKLEGETAGKIRIGTKDIARAYAGDRLVFNDFEPAGVAFDGSTYLSASLAPGSNKMIGSMWLKSASDGGSFDAILSHGTVGPIFRNNDNSVLFYDGSGGIFLDGGSAANKLLVADGWRHLLFSLDMSDSGKRLVYLDDAALPMTYTVYSDKDFPTTSYRVGGGSTSSYHFQGSIAELYLHYGEFMDISIEANRRKFITADGTPAWLGNDASFPTGSAPLVYLGGRTASASDWYVNRGTGGNFTVTGTLTDEATAVSTAT